jgi:hypothetical protein
VACIAGRPQAVTRLLGIVNDIRKRDFDGCLDAVEGHENGPFMVRSTKSFH